MLGAGKSQTAEHGTSVEGLQGSGANAGAFSFGKYQLFASLGRGGMADVFLAVSRGPMGFNKLVVIKRLKPALAEEAAFRQMFLDEARLAARLNHPNVVHTYEVGEHNGIYFIAMEYLEGQSLNKVMKEVIKRGDRVDPLFVARIIAEALNGLHHAHELKDYDGRPLNIIHRDISPHNIFATYDGHIKLVDFGIAKAALSSTETEVGVLKGKVAYMAPEQAMGGPIDARADLFAMGIVLWEMLTRERLMTGDSAANTLHRLMNVPIPRVSELVPDVDPVLEDIVAKSLQKNPGARFQSAAEMRDALEDWIQSTGRTAKQDEIGRMLSGMFQRVHEEVQRQIQTHMAAVATASSTGELQALTADSLKRLEQNGSTKLLRLSGSGSGSGVISTLPPPPAEPSQPSAQPPAQSGSAGISMASVSGARLALPMPPPSMPQAQPAGGGRIALLLLALLLGIGFVVTLALLLRKPRVEQTGPIAIDDLQPIASTGQLAPAPPPPPPPPLPAVTAVPTSTSPPPVAADPVVAPTITPTRKPNPGPPHGTSHPKPPPVPTAPAPPPSATAAQSDDPGFLTLQTYPFTKVSEGGRSLGTTPLYKVPLSPGVHVLTLENSDQSIKQSYTVTIKSGETANRNLGLK